MVEGKPRSPVLTSGLIEILKENVCKGNGSRVQVLGGLWYYVLRAKVFTGEKDSPSIN